MAIQTVNADNLASFAASREAKGSKLSSAQDVTDASVRIAEAKSPVIRSVEEKVDGIPDPGSQEPTAKAQADKAKAGTDPGVQKRFDELTKARKEAEELFETEYTEKLAERAKREAAEKRLAELESKPKVEELKKPDPNDPKYNTVASYLVDKDLYDSQTLDKKIEQAKQDERNRIALEQANAALERKSVEARKKFEDFDDVIAEAVRDKLEPPEVIQSALRESEVGLEIAYHLAKYPEDRERIFALPPWKALREIGKLEDKYLEAPKGDLKVVPVKPVETSKAPAPVVSVQGTTGGIPTDLTKAAFQEYREARMEQLRKRRRH